MTVLTIIAALIVLVGTGTAIIFMAATWHIQRQDSAQDRAMNIINDDNVWATYEYRGYTIIITEDTTWRSYTPHVYLGERLQVNPTIHEYSSPIDALSVARNRIIALIAREQEHAA
jgi:hypothetical protein